MIPIGRIFRTLKHRYARYVSHYKKKKTKSDSNEVVMAKWTRRLGIYTFWLVVCAFVSAGISFFQWRTTNDQLKEMHEQFIADKRAWIAIDIQTDGPLTWYPNGSLELPLKFILRNTGNIPALHVTLSGKAFQSMGGMEPNPVQEQKKFSDETRKHPIPGGLTIFPNDTVLPFPYRFVISREEIEAARLRWKKIAARTAPTRCQFGLLLSDA